LSIVFGLAVGLGVVGCDMEQAVRELAENVEIDRRVGPADSPSTAPASGDARPLPESNGDSIRVASFNIQVFGQSKSEKPEVMDVLARVVRRFDVVAIQEIRSKDQSLIPDFVKLINAGGSHYTHVLGPRLGRTSSKEQYAYVFDGSRIEIDRNSIYTVSDPDDLLHREPLVTRFRVRGPPPTEAFTFTLVNIHTDPDETDIELDALADVFRTVQLNGSGEDDVILLGDLNVDQYDLGRLGRVPNIAWVVGEQPTNTRKTKSYDNIVFDRTRTVEFTGAGGVLDLMDTFGLTEDQALDVSDHLPVWAEFDVREGRRAGPVAAHPQPPTR
jgi:endonuclease/exonuclease/phosphatase family metal-dependent hydrolase